MTTAPESAPPTGDAPSNDNRTEVSVRRAAREYSARGWHPITLKPASKQPAGGKGWQKRDYPPESFPGDANIGVLLGPPSGHLVDIDLDIAEARQLADHLLGDLPGFGRVSAPGGHRLVFCPDAPRKITKFGFTAGAADFAAERFGLRPDTDNKCVVLELRGNGQTMFPPSLHPSGERVGWIGGAAPETVPECPYEDLLRRLSVLAFLAVVLRAYPREKGCRDEVCLALSGTLAMLDLEAERVNELVTLVARLAADEEADDRRKGAGTCEKLEAGEPVTRLPRLCELLSIEPLEKTLRKWLGLGADDAQSVPEGAIDLSRIAVHEIVDDLEQVFLARGNVWRRGPELVRIRTLERPEIDTKRSMHRHAGVVEIARATPGWLKVELSKSGTPLAQLPQFEGRFPGFPGTYGPKSALHIGHM